jgi:chromosome segregation ATPase
MNNTFLNWLLDNWELLSAIIAFIVYFKIDKRNRNAQARQSEGNALSTMQEAYDKFTEDYTKEFDRLQKSFEQLQKSKVETELSLNNKIKILENKLSRVEKERIVLLKKIRDFELQAEQDKKTIDGLTKKIDRYEEELSGYRMDMKRFR